MITFGPDKSANFYSLPMHRKDESGVIFLTCDRIPEFFVAVTSEDEIRPALDRNLKVAFGSKGQKTEVFTNGSLSGPTIETVVRIA
jgi:hypothetical protein